jgi:hypothetical protein
MNQKIYSILILVIFSLILFNSASAILGYLRPAIMKIRLNTTDTVERSLTIKNVNNVTIVVNSSISGNISEIITIKNPSFELLPNETKTMDFVTKTDKPGVYSGQIILTYNNEPIQLTSDITVIAIGTPKTTGSPKKGMDTNTVLIIATVIIVIIAILFFKNKRGSKK